MRYFDDGNYLGKREEENKRMYLPNVGEGRLPLTVGTNPPLELDACGECARLGSSLPCEPEVGSMIQ